MKFKFEVGKTYVQVDPRGSQEPRTIVYVDQNGWGYHIHTSNPKQFVNGCPKPELVFNNPEASAGWKEYVPPKEKEMIVFLYEHQGEIIAYGYSKGCSNILEFNRQYNTAALLGVKKVKITEGEGM